MPLVDNYYSEGDTETSALQAILHVMQEDELSITNAASGDDDTDDLSFPQTFPPEAIFR